jgi:hypothetical protein
MDMKNLKTYSMFESVMELTQEQVEWLDEYADGEWKLNRQTGFVDVDGDFYCSGQNLQDFKGVRFGTVGRGFSCKNNQLTTLEGAPQTVGGGFYCGGNPVSESTLKVIFALIRKGIAYQQALEECWPEMEDEDRALMYKEMSNLPPEDVRKYKALATYSNIKDYL